MQRDVKGQKGTNSQLGDPVGLSPSRESISPLEIDEFDYEFLCEKNLIMNL